MIRLSNIDPSKECLKFLEKRIDRVDYRGNQVSQHNRYDKVVVKETLKEMCNVAGNDFMQIRTTDLSKRPYNISGEGKYAQFVTNLCKNKKVGRGTQDSIRKNHFVDLDRMGLICRFTDKKEIVYPYERRNIKFVKISELGMQFLQAEDIFKESLIYTTAIDNLMGHLQSKILELIVAVGNKISQDEYTLFASFLGKELLGKVYDVKDVRDMIMEYRNMSVFSRKAVLDKIQKYCKPSEFIGNKIQKRDWHNWKNETQQVFMLLGQTSLFEVREEKLVVRIGVDKEISLFENMNTLKRSISEKYEYFKYHKVKKVKGFELHHIVPICYAHDRNEFLIIDNHKNMVYIDGFSHSKITQNSNRNIKLSFLGTTVVLSDFSGEKIQCEHNSQIYYNTDKQGEMLEYNANLLEAKM